MHESHIVHESYDPVRLRDMTGDAQRFSDRHGFDIRGYHEVGG